MGAVGAGVVGQEVFSGSGADLAGAIDGGALNFFREFFWGSCQENFRIGFEEIFEACASNRSAGKAPAPAAWKIFRGWEGRQFCMGMGAMQDTFWSRVKTRCYRGGKMVADVLNVAG